MEEKKTPNIKEKLKEGWAWTKKKASEAFQASKEFYNENKEFLMVLVPLAFGGFKVVSKAAKNHHDAKEEKDYRDRSIWDPKSGQWFTTRKAMTPNQRSEFARRKSEGEDTYKILNDMRLI